MNLKDLVDKLSNIDKLEKISTQLDKKIPGEQPNLDPKADVNAMAQALNAVRAPAMSPNTVQQPQQTTEPEAAPQDTSPPEKRDLQQKNKPGEPIAEKSSQETDLERVKKDPKEFFKLANDEARQKVWDELDDNFKSRVQITGQLVRAGNSGDAEKIKQLRTALSNLEQGTTTDEPGQPEDEKADADEPKDNTAQSNFSQEDIDAQQRLTQQLGQAYAQVMAPNSGQSEAAKAAVKKSYEEAAAKLDSMKGAATSTPTAEPKPASATAKSNLGSGDWYRGNEGDYTIQQGDTLSSISKRTGVPLSQLMRMNNIQNPNKIVAGAKLKTGADASKQPAQQPETPPTPAQQPETPPTPAPTVNNPYTGADAEKFASLTPQDQEWLTRGGGAPNINDPSILGRAPNKGQTAAAQPEAPPATATTPNIDDLKQQAAAGDAAARSKIANTFITGTEKPVASPTATSQQASDSNSVAQSSPVRTGQAEPRPLTTKNETVSELQQSLDEIVKELLGRN